MKSIGFFDNKELQSANAVGIKSQSCLKCGLYKCVKTPRMQAFGKYKKGILNCGEAPGEHEDRRGKQWQGKIGMALQNAYNELGFDLFEDCININSVNCRPMDTNGNNRAPTPNEINACRKRVLRVIDEYKPKVIILFGEAPIRSIIGYRWTRGLGGGKSGSTGIATRWRGWVIPDRNLNAWVCPVFHPGYVERNDEHVERIWKNDLKNALRYINIPFPEYQDEYKQIQIVHNSEDVLKVILSMKLDCKPIAFDYETNRVKPHDKEKSKIICVSLCNNLNIAYGFTFEKLQPHLSAFRKLLQDNNCPKIAHNIKFEHSWTYNILGYEVTPWLFDSMIASHILDNRDGITSLEFETYKTFGVIDFKSTTAEYLKAKDSKNANSDNHIEELISTPKGLEILLTRNILDSLFTYRLAMWQMKLLCLDSMKNEKDEENTDYI